MRIRFNDPKSRRLFIGLACLFAVVVPAIVLLSGCASAGSDAGSAPSGAGSGSASTAASAGASADATATASVAPTSGEGGDTPELIFAATADNRHSWITAEARVTGVTAEGTCEYTAAAEGVETMTRTAKALASTYDTICADMSFELGTPGTYTITVSVTGVTEEPLTGSTEVEFLGASAS